MTIAELALRCLIVYGYLLAAVRLTGRGSMRRARPFDFVIGIVLGNLADNAIWGNIPQSEFYVAVMALLGSRLLFGVPLGRRRMSIDDTSD
jgi:uncharacterized membrane protein YcaP (DUF421 family)